ncbi:MAG: inositol monophosphatase family protein [Anaerolinea sp.]|nr:inositol monophosphatase family protein [Anaerolinea sp.]
MSMTTSGRDRQAALEFALDAAYLAGRITLGYFQAGIKPERKGDNTPVTIADRSAEQKLRELIAAAYPGDGIIGEEYGRSAGETGYTWIIDPIDGTKSFVSGVPIYGCLLALVDRDDQPLVGVAHYPALNETIAAVKGQGAYWNGRRARVSTTADLADAVLLMSDIVGYDERGKGEAFRTLVSATYIQRTWGDSYGYLLVATGRADIMIDPVMNIWDCAPFGVILPEAGGTFTDWRGKPTINAGESIATNGALFDAVLAITRGR